MTAVSCLLPFDLPLIGRPDQSFSWAQKTSRSKNKMKKNKISSCPVLESWEAKGFGEEGKEQEANEQMFEMTASGRFGSC